MFSECVCFLLLAFHFSSFSLSLLRLVLGIVNSRVFVCFFRNCIGFSGLASSFPFNSIVCVCMSHHAVAFRREHLVCWFFYVIFSSFIRGGESWHFLSRLEGNFQIVRHLFSVDRIPLLLMGDEKMISTWRTLCEVSRLSPITLRPAFEDIS